jgi:hypothetical protein
LVEKNSESVNINFLFPVESLQFTGKWISFMLFWSYWRYMKMSQQSEDRSNAEVSENCFFTL